MAPNPEVRVHVEGALRWVQASGTGAWQTASGAATGLIGYVQAGLAFTQSENFVTIYDRGVAKHQKWTQKPTNDVTFTVMYGVTANYPDPATASGASVPEVHLEFRQQQTEIAAGSAIYYQFLNCTIPSKAFAEAEAGNTLAFTLRPLSIVGPTASGYLV